MTKTLKMSGSLSVLALAFGSAPAWSQTAVGQVEDATPANGVEDIIVTAQFRSQRLQDTPARDYRQHGRDDGRTQPDFRVGPRQPSAQRHLDDGRCEWRRCSVLPGQHPRHRPA